MLVGLMLNLQIWNNIDKSYLIYKASINPLSDEHGYKCFNFLLSDDEIAWSWIDVNSGIIAHCL